MVVVQSWIGTYWLLGHLWDRILMLSAREFPCCHSFSDPGFVSVTPSFVTIRALSSSDLLSIHSITSSNRPQIQSHAWHQEPEQTYTKALGIRENAVALSPSLSRALSAAFCSPADRRGRVGRIAFRLGQGLSNVAYRVGIHSRLVRDSGTSRSPTARRGSFFSSATPSSRRPLPDGDRPKATKSNFGLISCLIAVIEPWCGRFDEKEVDYKSRIMSRYFCWQAQRYSP